VFVTDLVWPAGDTCTYYIPRGENLIFLRALNKPLLRNISGSSSDIYISRFDLFVGYIRHNCIGINVTTQFRPKREVNRNNNQYYCDSAVLRKLKRIFDLRAERIRRIYKTYTLLKYSNQWRTDRGRCREKQPQHRKRLGRISHAMYNIFSR